MKFTTKEQELLTKELCKDNIQFYKENRQLIREINRLKSKLEQQILKNKYKGDMNWCIQHITYYDFLNKKINRKYKTNHNLLKTIRTYDYLSPVAY